MAHTSLAISGKILDFSDGDLLAIAKFLILEIKNSPSLVYMPEASRVWTGALEGYGPGFVNLQLDRLLNSDGARAEFSDLLDRVNQRISEFGVTVPGSVLNGLPPKIGLHASSDPVFIALLGDKDLDMVIYEKCAVQQLLDAIGRLRGALV